ncbi:MULTISPECIES: hypothetical protein [Kordiimonas]|jgi:hypothetical protein|uniref:SnoaL-like domain-containing protein n=1 Tax=Kordiimonas lacus TaxID=637679 RepID=A0A1G6U230_9PROT|nr:MULTISPECIES: hypothetical protein [Kordiimonas]SDD35254.1 hypothetical protein SAMN04488071_0440 [Kordiimonas lacus]
MKRFLLSAMLLIGLAAPVHAAPDYIGTYHSTPEDEAAIREVIARFDRGIREKDGELLKSTFLHDEILFISPPYQAVIDDVRERYDPDFMKVGPMTEAMNFVNFITTTESTVAENFYNIEITQDQTYALVTFDYEFVVDDKVTNYGLEVWQLFKVDGRWGIASVNWSVTMLE